MADDIETFATKLAAVAAAIEDIEFEPDARVHICLGSPRCHGEDAPCAFCYCVEAKDPRSVAEILAAAEKGH